MGKETKPLEKNRPPQKSKWRMSILIGTMGALIWTSIGYLVYWLNFSKISPSGLARLFIKPEYLYRWEGIATTYLIAIIMSMLISILYCYLFSHIYSPWLGAGIGILLWISFFSWRHLELNTLFSTLSLFTLYGAFIGFSLSAEFSSTEKKQSVKS